MVNPSSQEFVLLAEPLINIYRNPNSFIDIKNRTANPRNRDYCQGDIKGTLDILVPDEEAILDVDDVDELDLNGDEYARITLFFGSTEKPLVQNKELTGFLNIVDRHEYKFPWDEFRSFVIAIEAMYTQHTEFTLLRMNGDILVKRDTSLL
jgi:hypothetical protein